jgi:uncharacterized SAM-binding protein YcdF (DUF218 family)
MALWILLVALRRPRRSLIGTALLLLWFFGTPIFADLLLSSLEDQYPYRTDDKCPQADAIFVFGGMLGLRGYPGDGIAWNEAAERFGKAVDLYKARRSPVLVLSGGAERYEGGPDEGELLKAHAITLGIPARAILVTPETFNTKDEAKQLCQLAEANQWKRVLIITSAYHMPRAMQLIAGCPAECVPVPVAFSTPEPHSSWAYRRIDYFLPQAHALFFSELALREYLGIFLNWIYRIARD